MLQIKCFQWRFDIYLFPKCPFSLHRFSFFDIALEFPVDKHMFQMVLLVVELVSLYASFAFAYVFELYDSFYNNHQVHHDSFVRMSLIHCLIRNILQLNCRNKKNKNIHRFIHILVFSHTEQKTKTSKNID